MKAGEKRTRQIVHERRGELCEYCGRGGPVEMHHRKPRSQLGQWSPTNIIGLCSPCHHWATVNPKDACAAGVSVKSYQDEYEIPVAILGRMVYLNDDGTMEEY